MVQGNSSPEGLSGIASLSLPQVQCHSQPRLPCRMPPWILEEDVDFNARIAKCRQHSSLVTASLSLPQVQCHSQPVSTTGPVSQPACLYHRSRVTASLSIQGHSQPRLRCRMPPWILEEDMDFNA
ncbi:hypothetical protein ACOMHN_043758 [Nucella lapillus]